MSVTLEQRMSLQRRLGVEDDGVLGRGTFTALFRKFGAPAAIGEELGLAAVVHLPAFGILDAALRLVHFIGQCAHETLCFTRMDEIASGAAYEGREDLGNVVAGDGRRYKGRGALQLTGRANYRTFGRALGIDLERYPTIAAYPSIGLLSSCRFWKEKGLNELADQDRIEAITRRINGGTTGLAERRRLTGQARVLIIGAAAAG